jgi:hypothetical protein
MHDRLIAGGNSSTLDVYADVPHGWQMLVPFAPESVQSGR